MEEHKRSIRHREISAFQSIAEMVARKKAEKGDEVPFNLAHPLIGGVTHFLGRLYDAHPHKDPAEVVEVEDHIDSSMLSAGIHVAWRFVCAVLRGRPEDVGRILKDIKDSTLDPEWVEAIVKYVEVYGIHHLGSPVCSEPNECPRNSEFTVLPDSGAFRVALIADWGTGEAPGKALLKHVVSDQPDCLIHLGDVYYSGTHQEYASNFLDLFDEMIPRRADGTRIPIFNLAGNHDYYSGGAAFLEATMKLNGPGPLEQKGGSFALRNPSGSWCLQGMDTGYNDHDPIANKHHADTVEESMTRLREDDAKWQQEQLEKTAGQGGKTILLSHHQLFSAFSSIGDETRKPSGTQFTNINLQKTFGPWLEQGGVAAWFWGHEHSLGIYEPYAGLAKGRCIGCGAIPVVENNKPYEPTLPHSGEQAPQLLQQNGKPVMLQAHRLSAVKQAVYNLGYTLLDFDGDSCVARYIECNESETTQLFEETIS